MTKTELENKLATLFGGRVAEELVYQELSTGAQDDLIKATDIARSMVRAYGMSRKLGHVSFDRPASAQFLEAPVVPRGEYSEEVLQEIDAEVRWTLDEQYARATRLLRAQLPTLRRAAAELLRRETLFGEELAAIAADTSGSVEERNCQEFASVRTRGATAA
jgi:cell division protease FtsH